LGLTKIWLKCMKTFILANKTYILSKESIQLNNDPPQKSIMLNIHHCFIAPKYCFSTHKK